jgi:N-acetylmuramoyl-L-alanine amidase
MNVMIKIFTTIGLLVPQFSFAATNYLTNVYHHKGKLSDNISYYFSKEPIITYLPERVEKRNAHQKEGWRSFKFLFPKAEIGSGQVRQLVEQLNNSFNNDNTALYNVTIESVAAGHGPKEGLLVTLSYDEKKVVFEYETFTAIQQQAGVLFKFYNLDLLKEINRRSNPIQHFAFNDIDKKKIRIVIDNGHGGEDSGKVGWGNIKEKDINLTIGMKVAHLLRDHGFIVSLTRNVDRFVPLDVRTTFANHVAHANIFVSLHSNGAPNESASGIETFCLQPTLFNKGSTDHVQPKTVALISALESERYKKSYLLADYIQHNTISAAKMKTATVQNRKVKKAISQVLLGADMPAALIEMGFLSNEREATLLNSPEYQQLIAQGICNGIVSYVQDCVMA